MARAGRKRSTKPRNKDGRCKRETVDEIRSVAVAQRAKVVPIDQATSEKASTPLGVLYLNGKLTLAEYQAGVTMTSVFAAWRWANCAPSPFPASMGGRSSGVLNLIEEDVDIKRRKKALDVYNDAKAVILDCGTPAYLGLVELCGHERPVMSIDPVKRGLKALVAHFGLQHFEERG